jgi:hypothetical protein
LAYESRNSFFLLLISLFLFGCAKTARIAMYDDRLKRPAVASIDVVRAGQRAEKPFKEIGEIVIEDYCGEEAHAIRELVSKGKSIGADAILMQPRQDTGYDFVPFGRSGNKCVWKAIAIVYRTDSASK